MSKVQFVDLPEKARPGAGTPRDPRWAELDAHPGQWAEYWGNLADARYVWQVARQASHDGRAYEACVRNNRPYIRAVGSES